jgi:serine/threonine protein kinase
MGNGPSTMGAGEQGQSEFVPRTHQQAVAHYQALGQMRGKRIPSDEEFRPYSVGKAPHPSEKIWPTRVTHTPPGSPASQQISSSCRSKDAPRLYESLSLRNDFEILEELGASAEGTVYLGKHKRSGEVVALKTLKKKAVSMDVRDLPEDCLLQLDAIGSHRNILFLSQIDIAQNGSIWMCMSLCNAGDMLDYLNKANESHLGPEGRLIFALHVFIQLGEALAFLHHGLSRNDRGEWSVSADYPGPLLHNDVKPDNVMLHFSGTNDMGMPDVRLGDFGATTWACKPRWSAGTPSYYCPEALNWDNGIRNGPRMQMASDVYTFGLTMYYLITGGTRWPPGKGATYLRLPQAYEDLGMTRVLQNCLMLDPKKRPTMNHDPVSGLMRCVDYAYAERAQMHSREGHIASFFWLSWRGEAAELERGT